MNKLTLNISKTKFMIIASKHKQWSIDKEEAVVENK